MCVKDWSKPRLSVVVSQSRRQCASNKLCKCDKWIRVKVCVKDWSDLRLSVVVSQNWQQSMRVVSVISKAELKVCESLEEIQD